MVSHFYRALGIVILGILEQTMSGVLTISIELEQSENSFYLLFLIVHFFREKHFNMFPIFFYPKCMLYVSENPTTLIGFCSFYDFMMDCNRKTCLFR